MTRAVLVLVLASCAEPSTDARARIGTALQDDNFLWAIREPALTRMKFVKMQRGPYEWMRGTASLFWRDVMEPGQVRPTTAFGDAASSRVLLVGDPHVENVGTYRASDGTMFVDWNDFDSTGYGPYTGDLRRLGVGLALTSPDDAEVLIAAAARAYADTMREIAGGARPGPIRAGVSALFDDELETAAERGAILYAIDELAPVTDGKRALAYGDLERPADDGVLEDRVAAVDAETVAWIDRAVAQWAPPDAGAIKLRARRIGSGVASYAAYRWNVVLEGATTATDDDRVIEIKETREGVIIRGQPRLGAAEWASPGARAVDTQRRLHARSDGDAWLGSALVGGLSVKIRDREAFQRGVDSPDVAELALPARTQLAATYGSMLARAHGLARTEDGLVGHSVIAPLLAGREDAFVAEQVQFSIEDAAQIVADYELMKDRDLFAEVIP